MRETRTIESVLVAAALLLVGTGSSRADLTFTGSGTDGTVALGATADFSLSGTTLTLTLTNTGDPVTAQQDILLAVLFNVTAGSLTPVSASTNGSTVLGSYPSGSSSPGDGWQYLTSISNSHYPNMNSGVSGAGYGVFGPSGNFGPNPQMLDGSDYGIVSTGSTVSNKSPYFENSLQFTLTTSSGFTLSDISSSNVIFQYGTSLTEPSVTSDPGVLTPEPSTLAVAAFGAFAFVGYGVRRRRKG